MGCTGKCCAAFPLSGYDYPELERRYHRLVDGGTVFDMVRPLTRAEAIERRARFGQAGELPDEPMFRCVRWDERTGLCTRYDERPALCSDYPYDRSCDHDCGHREPWAVRLFWTALRAGGTAMRSYDGVRFVEGVAAMTLPA